MDDVVVSAKLADQPQLAKLLADAFSNDPVNQWLLESHGNTQDVRTRFFHSYLTTYLRDAVVQTLPNFGGAAMWAQPGYTNPKLLDDLRDYWRWMNLLKGASLKTARLNDRMKKLRPTQPHWYLALLGTPAEFRGKGYGGKLLEHQLNNCDREGIMSYLESSNEANIGLYMRYGFKLTNEFTVAGSPRLYTMERQPQ